MSNIILNVILLNTILTSVILLCYSAACHFMECHLLNNILQNVIQVQVTEWLSSLKMPDDEKTNSRLFTSVICFILQVLIKQTHLENCWMINGLKKMTSKTFSNLHFSSSPDKVTTVANFINILWLQHSELLSLLLPVVAIVAAVAEGQFGYCCSGGYCAGATLLSM
jgi:hypothetical protein